MITRLSDSGKLPVLQMRHIAGAMNRQPADMTAFSYRDSEVLIYYSTAVEFGASDQEVNDLLEAWRALEPFGAGCYINMSSEATDTEIARAFPQETLNRLREIKDRYDPNNIFDANYNIRPIGTNNISS